MTVFWTVNPSPSKVTVSPLSEAFLIVGPGWGALVTLIGILMSGFSDEPRVLETVSWYWPSGRELGTTTAMVVLLGEVTDRGKPPSKLTLFSERLNPDPSSVTL